MENGRITEAGPHAEMVERDGPYAALWASWHGTAPDAAVVRRGRPPAFSHG